jgi:hypothetical protein
MGMSKRDWCNIPVSVPWRSTGQWRDLRIWLIENVHDMDYDAYAGVDLEDYDRRVFYFAQKKDAVLFALRWA